MDYEDMNLSVFGENASDFKNSSGYMDYDRDESFNMYFLDELIPVALVYGITLVVGLIGNILIIYTVVSFRRMRTISNVFLASLATADLLVVIICVPVKFGQLFSYSWALGEFGCKFVHYVQNVSAICSVLTLTSMSVERYYAIMHPVKSRYQCTMRQARRLIIVIWILSFVTAVPIIFAQIHIEVGERYKAFWCVRNWHQPWLWRSYEVYMMLLILIAPSLIMGFAYSKICHQLWIVMKDRASMVSGEMPGTEIALKETHPRNQFLTYNNSNVKMKKPKLQKLEADNTTVKQVIKMLVAVVILFIICWGPILITNVLTSFDILDRLNYGYLKPMRTAFHLLSYFNSCINPCVYGFLSANFRNSFKAAFLTCMCGKTQKKRVQRALSRTGTTSVSYARSTFIT
ncbi:QRFP-like peptide receptor [Parasteatoda tepidariorum]|uniref:QRFP-like peptide receptor n=1 Tax=Parasteatoda tepidariorum TaxID=114398 RepID=UPI00077FBE07|nr:QRFP-like peptide receptor [Parasteatoda tepidariorum]